MTVGLQVNSSYSVGTADVTVMSYDYDANGNVVRATDGNQVLSGTAAAAHVTSYYDKAGRKTKEVDQEGYLTRWEHDAEGNVLSERRYATRFIGEVLPSAPPTVATDNNNDRVTNFVYDRNGRRTSETRTGIEAYTVNSSGATSGPVTQAIIQYSYNALGLVTAKTEATGDVTDYGYDVAGRLQTEKRAGYYDHTDVNDHGGAFVRPTVDYRYNALGDLVRTRQGGESAASGDRVTTYSYGAGGRLALMTDPSGENRAYAYDAAGNVVRESYTRYRADGLTASASWDAILTTRDLLGRATTQRMAGWNAASASWVGESQTTAYNAYGEVSARGLNGLTQELFNYDAGGRLESSNEGDGVWRYHLYDANGRRTLTIESEGVNLDNLTMAAARTAATSGGSAWLGGAYVNDINVTISVLDKRGLEIERRLPFRQLSGNVTAAGAANLVSSRSYNAFGEAVSETDLRNNTTDYKYDALGRVIEKKSPQVAYTGENGVVVTGTRPTESYYYDQSGRLVRTIDANLGWTTRAYLAGTGYGGSEGLVTATFQGTSSATHLVTRTFYDHYGDARVLRNGLLTSATTVHHTASDELRSYDGLGRVTQVIRRGGLP